MIKALVDLIEQNLKQNMVVCEIGTWIGNTTKNYLPLIKQVNGQAICIDWFKGNENVLQPPSEHVYKPEKQKEVFLKFCENISEYLDYVNILIGESQNLNHLIPDNSLDICFIDADHRYLPVKKDIELYLPKVKKGGIICGHDMTGDISMAGCFTEEQLATDCHNNIHCGIIQAVYDHFGLDIEIIRDDDGDKMPLWVKRL